MADDSEMRPDGATLPPGQFPDDPGYLASLEADCDTLPAPDAPGTDPAEPVTPSQGFDGWGDGLEPAAPIQPARVAKLPLFRAPLEGAAYPVDALPPLLKDAVLAIVDKTQCDPAIAAGSVLGAAALAVQAHADVVTPHGQTVPTSLYLLTLAESGDRKSAADDLAMTAVREAEAAGQEARRVAWGEYLRAKELWQADKAEAMKVYKKDRANAEAMLKAAGEEPRAPLDPSIVLTEPTIAGMEKTFQAARGGLGLFSDEGGQMLGGHAMRDESRLHTLTALNNLWQGKPIKRTRAGDGNALMPGRRLSLHLMIQPGIAPKLLGDPDAVKTGLVARLLVAAPPSRPGTRPFKMPDPASAAKLARFNAALSALLAQWPHVPGDPQCLAPRRLEMTAGARAAWIAFHDTCQERVAPGGAWEGVTRAWGEKAPEQAARLAGVVAVMVDPNAEAVDTLSMQQAIRLAEYYGAEMVRLVGQSMVDPKTLEAAKLLDWIKAKGWDRFPLVHVYQFGPAGLRTAAQAREACERLVAHGELAPMPDGIVRDGKRHREAWRVVPD
jgi:hypothetical protein